MKEKNTKVYVLAPRTGLDYTKAKTYGEVVEIEPNSHPADISSLEDAADSIEAHLTDEDYLMPSATPSSSILMAFIVGKKLMSAKMGQIDIKILVFDSRLDNYKTRTISI